MTELPKVTIYSDGACSGNPGPGGWAAVLISESGKRMEISGGECDSTNNRMEVTAALEALRSLNQPCQVTFYTDSSYLLNGATKWLPDWKKRNWKRKEGQLANVGLWQAMDVELAKHQVDWVWVKGHAGNSLNERADSLARKATPVC